MASLLEELGHRKETTLRITPLSKEASAAGVGLFVGVLLMIAVCLAIKMA